MTIGTWQPIETAPKDGTPVLLWAEDAALDAYWRDPRWGDGLNNDYKPRPSIPFVGFWNGRGWQLAHYTAFTYRATLWMPCEGPPGPAEDGKVTEGTK